MADTNIREMPGIFELFQQSLNRCSEACLNVNESNFEQLL